jgi:hypothetical protein
MGQERYGGRPAYLIVARTLLNVSQVLPRRKGDLWLHVSSLFFKTWERRHAVIDGALARWQKKSLPSSSAPSNPNFYPQTIH